MENIAWVSQLYRRMKRIEHQQSLLQSHLIYCGQHKHVSAISRLQHRYIDNKSYVIKDPFREHWMISEASRKIGLAVEDRKPILQHPGQGIKRSQDN